MCELRFHNASALAEIARQQSHDSTEDDSPTFWAGRFEVSELPADTFLHLSVAWETGIAFVNGFNLGRFDAPSPQKDLYVPSPLLHEGTNEVVILDTRQRPRRSTDM